MSWAFWSEPGGPTSGCDGAGIDGTGGTLVMEDGGSGGAVEACGAATGCLCAQPVTHTASSGSITSQSALRRE